MTDFTMASILMILYKASAHDLLLCMHLLLTRIKGGKQCRTRVDKDADASSSVDSEDSEDKVSENDVDHSGESADTKDVACGARSNVGQSKGCIPLYPNEPALAMMAATHFQHFNARLQRESHGKEHATEGVVVAAAETGTKTCLFEAAHSGYTNVARHLIARQLLQTLEGSTINIQSSEKWPQIQTNAPNARDRHPQRTQDVNCQKDDSLHHSQRTLITVAMVEEFQSQEDFADLLAHAANEDNELEIFREVDVTHGLTAVMVAAYRNNEEFVTMMHEMGAHKLGQWPSCARYLGIGNKVCLKNCGLTCLPLGLEESRDVITLLDLSYNEIPELPTGVCHLHNLTVLNCAHNKLVSLPAGVVSLFPFFIVWA